MLAVTPSLFGADEYELRAPKRGGRYAAQVWVPEGHWEAKRYETRKRALWAASRLACTEPEPGRPATCPETGQAVPWQRKRCVAHHPRHKWVRRVKGGAWQARPWLGEGLGSVNLGLFTAAQHGDLAEWSAAQVARAFMRLWKPGVTVAEAVERLKRAPNARDRCRADLTVPERLRDATPPMPAGPTEYAAERDARLRRERAERRERAYGGRGLFDA